MRALLVTFLLFFSTFAPAKSLVEVPAVPAATAHDVSTPVVELDVDPSAQTRLVAAPGRAVGAARSLAPELAPAREELRLLLGDDELGTVEVRIAHGREEFFALQPRGARPPGWAAGVAYPSRALVVLDVVASTRGGAPVSVLRHELAHVALGKIAPQGVPRWFTEGFAQVYANEWSLSRSISLGRAASSSSLLPMNSLERDWPDAASDVELAYAQSASYVSHLVQLDEGAALRRLIARLRDGLAFDDALHAAYGAAPISVELAWKDEVRGRYGFLGIVQDPNLVFAVTALVLIAGVVRLRRRSRKRLAEMEAEERLLPPEEEPAPSEVGESTSEPTS